MIKYKRLLWLRCFPEIIQQNLNQLISLGKTLILVSAAILQHVSLGLISFQEWLFGIVFMKPLKEGDVT